MYIISAQKAIKIIEDFNDLKTFNDQMNFIINYKNILKICLDNDGEHIMFGDKAVIDSYEDFEDYCFNDFKDIRYFGNTDGVFKLFQFLGIEAENV